MNHCIPVSLLVPAALSLTTAMSAQITATYIAKTKMIATAFFSRTGSKTAVIPINTNLTGGKSISITNSARAFLSVGFSNTSSSLVARISESGTGRYFSSSTRASSSTGTHQTLLTVKTTKPTKATLRVTWATRIFGRFGASSSGAVDIGNNGSFEFSAGRTALTKDFPVTIDSKGLAIATSTRGVSSASSSSRSTSYSSSLTIQILPPQTCLFFSHGKPCGPTLSGKNGFEDKVHLNVTGAVKGGAGVLILGAQRTSVSLPGTACLLLVQPLVAVPLGFSATGTLSLTGSIPSARPFAMPMQVGSFGTTLGTSNALTVICP